MENVNPWAVLITAFFTALPVVIGQILAHIRQMTELRRNTLMTTQTQAVAVGAAQTMVDTADKLDSATRSQANTASAAATIAKSAAREARDAVSNVASVTADKVAAEVTRHLSDQATIEAIKVSDAAHASAAEVAKVAGEAQVKLTESVNKIAMAVSSDDDACLTGRISALSDRIQAVESDTKEILSLLKNGKERSAVRGEAS